MSSEEKFCEKFCEWLNKYNGSAFTAAKGIVDMLEEAQFKRDAYDQNKGYMCRNGSCVIAWHKGDGFNRSLDPQLIVLASHTDSPCLRTRPHDKVVNESCLQLSCSTYGGGLWHTWMDRPLGLAGCVTYDDNGIVKVKPVRINKPMAIVPNLCIHLQDRADAQTFKPAPEEVLRPILMSSKDDKDDEVVALREILEKECGISNILTYDLCLYDTSPAESIGYKSDMISAPGLDNKSSLWATFEALCSMNSVPDDKLVVCVGFDHEEVGSSSVVGADGDVLTTTVGKLLEAAMNETNKSIDEYWKRGLIVSCDAAHAVHPNYANKHQAQNKPRLNEGTVVKVNVNQRYATGVDTIGALKKIQEQMSSLKLQMFVVRNDTPCGSTIGPITATKTGCATVDVGMPIWAMHSCRETCGVSDLGHLISFCHAVCKYYVSPVYTW